MSTREADDPRTPLARLMDELGLRCAEVEALSGVGHRTITKLRVGAYSTIRVASLVAVAHAVGVPASSLVPGLDSRPVLGGATTRFPGALAKRVEARRAREAALRQRGSVLAKRETAAGMARAAARIEEAAEAEA